LLGAEVGRLGNGSGSIALGLGDLVVQLLALLGEAIDLAP
jgi:hypothetical protein